MFRFITIIPLCFCLISLSFADTNKRYRIGPGDLLSINVFGEKDLSAKEIRVSANATISFPLLGEVSVRNMSIRELESVLVRLLKDGYLKKPIVTISILEYRLFYINGEVKNQVAIILLMV